MDFKTFIKAVGTGPKGNRDLSEEETFQAITQILENRPTQAQIGAFLIAWRTKLESQSEFKGAIKALKNFMKFEKVEDSIELGYNFDGRNNNPYLFPLYEDILNNFFKNNSEVRRLNVVISGDLLQPTKKGITTKDIFLNFKETKYLHFFDRLEYLPKLSALTELRHEFGLRTAFNTIEKALNPALSEYAVVGAFHKPYVFKYIDMYEDYFKDVTVVRGSEGDIEIFKDSKFWQKKDGEIIETEFSLKDFGINYNRVFENITLEENLNILRNYDDDILKLAKFNVALHLLFSKRVDSLDEAWQRLN